MEPMGRAETRKRFTIITFYWCWATILPTFEGLGPEPSKHSRPKQRQALSFGIRCREGFWNIHSGILIVRNDKERYS